MSQKDDDDNRDAIDITPDIANDLSTAPSLKKHVAPSPNLEPIKVPS